MRGKSRELQRESQEHKCEYRSWQTAYKKIKLVPFVRIQFRSSMSKHVAGPSSTRGVRYCIEKDIITRRREKEGDFPTP